MKVSVIIVNYNTLHVLRPCLDSIIEHTVGIDYEIVVVDNGSTDGSVEALKEDKRIVFIPTGENLGFGRANNKGLEQAKGEYIFFLNSDTLLKNNAIKMLYDFAAQYQGKLGALGCLLEDRQGNPIHSYGQFPKMKDDFRKFLWIPILKAFHLYHEPSPITHHPSPNPHHPSQWMKVDYVTGADLFVSRQVLEACGAFHPAFFMYYEETEMEHRFYMNGYDNVLLMGPRIVHLEGEGGKDEKKSKFIRDTCRQERSLFIYYKLTKPRWKYYAYRIVHPILRQTVWLNPNVSLHDKWTFVKRLFAFVNLQESPITHHPSPITHVNILVDGRTWSLYSAGVGTFFTSAILEWAHQSDKDNFYIILPNGLDARYELPPLPSNIRLLDYTKRFPRLLPNIIILQVLVPHLCRKLAIDLYYSPVPHLPYFIPSKVKTMVTVHDVVNIEMAHTMSWTNRLATSFFFGQAIKKADLLWSNSYYTKTKIQQYFPERHCKGIFTGGAVDRRVFYPKTLTEGERQDIKQKYGIDDKFILFVGSLEPRKNLKFLLSIIPELYQQQDIQLVVVGGKGWKNSDIKEIIEAPEFPKASTIFCGHLTNEELAMLYRCADCFVSAALMEGLGMPQIEALLCGCPVVTAHNTAMIEVAYDKDGAVTVEGYEPQDWIQAILNTIKQRKTVNPQQLAEYNWTNIIRRLQRYVCLVALLLFTTFHALAEIPIVAYCGIPLEYSNVSRFKEFKEAGFDVSISFYDDTPVDTLLRILDDAQKCGIRLLLSSGWVSVQPHVGIPRLKNHPALYGYFLQDEPWPNDIQETARRYRAMAKHDTGKPTYVNLLPHYGDGMPKEIKMPPYKQYLRQTSAIGLPFISFDYYPVTKSGIRPTWYACLENVRQESLRTGKPFWAFALSTPHCDYPQPTIGMLRLQIYANLAYGAQAIQYFTYWTPKPTKEWDFHDGPISVDGRRTKNYALVKRMNQELRGILPLFDKAEIQTVNHFVKIPEGTTKLQRPPVNIKKLKVVASQGAIISTFKKDNHLYMAVVNKDYQSDMKLYITAKNTVKALTPHRSLQRHTLNERTFNAQRSTFKESPLKSCYNVGGGDILLFKLK